MEQVINGNTLRVCIPATHHHFTAQITGIRCPSTGQQARDGDIQDDPELGQRAKYAVEIRLLQRDVKIRFDGLNNQIPLVSVLHVVSVVVVVVVVVVVIIVHLLTVIIIVHLLTVIIVVVVVV